VAPEADPPVKLFRVASGGNQGRHVRERNSFAPLFFYINGGNCSSADWGVCIGRINRVEHLGHCGTLRGGDDAIKAQRGVALFLDADAFEPFEPAGQFPFVKVLDDHRASGSEQVRCIEEFQSVKVVRRLIVGRIDENKIREDVPRRQPLQALLDVCV